MLLVSVGTDGTATRSLRATYPLGSTNANILGGAIRVFPIAGNPDLCMDAGPASPVPGTPVTVQPCVDGDAGQAFGYFTDLSLVLVSSRRNPTAAAPDGLCLDAGSTQAPDDPVMLQPCSATAPGHQRWGFTDHANFSGTTDSMADTNLCINVKYRTSTAGDLIMGSCAHINDDIGVFSPEAAVGAGAAGISVATATGSWRQLVNFRQFGRCLDIPYSNVTWPYLISWPCKQGGYVGWNQRWALPADGAGQIRLDWLIGGTYRCLRSPSGTDRTYVDVTECGAGPTPDTTWTVVGRSTGDWDTDYRIIDSLGNCLAAKDQAAGDYFPPGHQISKIVVDTCSTNSPDKELQHWNAPPDIDPPAPLIDIAER